MRNGFEWLRLVTPLLSGLTFFLLTQMAGQLQEINARLYQHQTNADLHVTRAEFAIIQNQIEQMRQDILTTIRQEQRGP